VFNGGYLFLQQIYNLLGLPDICDKISSHYKFTFNLDSVLSRLIYGRIIYPCSKLATNELAKQFIEQPDFELQHIYRGLEVLAKEMDSIQSSVYQKSSKFERRNTNVLYYDCTNYFFEIECESGLKKYGASKEHKPNPIVQMGLFMDGDGIPLAFCINPGNTNEQITMRPLEEKIIKDFNLSKFIVCTDAGLASESNRLLNNYGDRAFITTQSIKKLKQHLKTWSLESDGWKLPGKAKTYDISKLEEDAHKESVFYKERWINENGLEQKLIVSYSIKYRDYQRSIRERQINRAQNALENSPAKVTKARANDYKRFIQQTHCTQNGEVAEKNAYSINSDVIKDEMIYDGFYAICSNLDDDISEIIKINKRRWEIEECFRIMKTEFKARPVYLSRDDRIKAHFLTCYLALLIYRLLEKRLEYKFTCTEIIAALKTMRFIKVKGEGYIPAYSKSAVIEAFHDKFGFKTDYQIITNQQIKKIIKMTKT
jgi:transposase